MIESWEHCVPFFLFFAFKSDSLMKKNTIKEDLTMIARKCDRCGRYYCDKANRRAVFEFYDAYDDTLAQERYDLCPSCAKIIKNVLKVLSVDEV